MPDAAVQNILCGDQQCKDLDRNKTPSRGDGFQSSKKIREEIDKAVREIILWIEQDGEQRTFFDFEKGLIPKVFRLGMLFVSLFLTTREEKKRRGLGSHMTVGGKKYERKGRKAREIGTFFGKVRYSRTYMHRAGSQGKSGKGFYPLDNELGLTADGFSMKIISLAGRLASKLAFGQAVMMLRLFLGWSPSQKKVEHMVLGLGAQTQKYLEQAPPPEGEGEVLVIQIDSKAAPTATKEELRKRRGKRKPNPHPNSQRHRGRTKRRRAGKKKRKKKGDKSKNGRMATLVVMYTLKKGPDGMLLGPINKRVYGSFAPKRHCVAWARWAAERRGFGPDSGKVIQFITDGDDDLQVYQRHFFKGYGKRKLIVAIDIMHVIEKLWSAGVSVYKEGSKELEAWVKKQKAKLYESRADLIISELKRRLNRIPLTGPGTKGKRKRISEAIKYISKRLQLMDYKMLKRRDLEVSTGVIEGAVRHIMGQRLDCSGMRWIKRRAEAVLQLRCIEVNGQWEEFTNWVHQQFQTKSSSGGRFRLLRKTPAKLPRLGVES